RLLSRRFPFAVYYRVEDGFAGVRAVLDCRRDPERTKNRLA
ncbi:MAG: type II toxin-antitoxin system RelE/ParE family toxin, partial [Kiritimatiellia bacterium]